MDWTEPQEEGNRREVIEWCPGINTARHRPPIRSPTAVSEAAAPALSDVLVRQETTTPGYGSFVFLSSLLEGSWRGGEQNIALRPHPFEVGTRQHLHAVSKPTAFFSAGEHNSCGRAGPTEPSPSPSPSSPLAEITGLSTGTRYDEQESAKRSRGHGHPTPPLTIRTGDKRQNYPCSTHRCRSTAQRTRASQNRYTPPPHASTQRERHEHVLEVPVFV